MTSEIIQILADRVAIDLEQLRHDADRLGGTDQLQLVLGPQAIEGLEEVMRGIAGADLDRITIHAGQLLRGIRVALNHRAEPSEEES